MRQIRSLKGHTSWVESLAWNGVRPVLSTRNCGRPVLSMSSRDTITFNHNVRIKKYIVGMLIDHHGEVCRINWSPSRQHFVSGGEDNIFHIWDVAITSSHNARNYLRHLEDHKEIVKALAWCPFQANLLTSRGSQVDRCIQFLNTSTGVCVNSIDTKLHVIALECSHLKKEILSSHGFNICIDAMQQLAVTNPKP